ncbi:DUF7882 family protein [Rathayibacter toxicus]|uniref:DUF7882 family protein n=1 Tax=Rathayibacter toxicus TaxID=145458 RepID=UPI0004270FC1
MGRLLYGGPESVHRFDDRALAHLHAVITSRFRRGEGFLLTIDDEDGRGPNCGCILASSPRPQARPRATRISA